MKRYFSSFAIATGLLVLLNVSKLDSEPNPPVSPSIIILNGYNSDQPSLSDSMFMMLRAIPALENSIAVADYKTDIQSVYPKAKLVIAQLRGMGWRGNDNGDTLKQQLTKAYTSGISILIYGDTYLQGANAIGDSYFSDTFGVRVSFMDVQEKITFLDPKFRIDEFAITGIGSDELGKTLSKRVANVEKSPLDNPSFLRFTGAIGSIQTSRSSVLPFLYYDSNEENIAGVRMVSTYDSRAVFLSFRIESIADSTLRSDFILRLVNWLNGSPTSVADESGNNILSIAPNPATDRVNIHIPQNQYYSAIYVTDILGNRILSVESEESSKDLTINTSTLATGIYRVVCMSSNKSVSTQLVIQR
jgi:hypothetical protein